MGSVGGRLLITTVFAVTCTACTQASTATQPAKPLTAAQILSRPDQANLKDAHFTLIAHVVSGSVSFDATGDGLVVIKPQHASQFTMLTTVQGQPLKFEEIIAGGKEYDLAPDNPRWTVKPASSTNPGSFQGTKAKLLGEETLNLGKAWHVRAIDANGNPFEAWIRESDGYPLKYVSNSQGTTFSAVFDRFNTGQTVTPPPASDIQP
jgi:hypothetical protein